MRFPFAALIALPLLVCAAPALADTPTDQTQASNATVAPPAPPTPPVKAKPKLDPNQMICKREEQTGSRLGGHEDCMTRAQWDDLSAETQHRLNDTTQRGQYTQPPKSGF